MAKVRALKRDGKTVQYSFWCDGCKTHHAFNDAWDFNGDYEKPTISPSILVRGTLPVNDDEFQKLIKGEKIEPKKFVCHSFIRDGKIQYLSDCTHELAGQTVELKDQNKSE